MRKTKKLIAVFPGTFDPLHNGHLDIMKDAVHAYKFKVIIVPGKVFSQESNKQETLFSLKEREAMIKEVIKNHGLEKDIVIKTLNGANNLMQAIQEFITEENVDCIIRGIRPDNQEDEEEIAAKWKGSLKIPAFFLESSEKNKNISSKSVKEKLKKGEDVSKLVPKEVLDFINLKN